MFLLEMMAYYNSNYAVQSESAETVDAKSEGQSVIVSSIPAFSKPDVTRSLQSISSAMVSINQDA